VRVRRGRLGGCTFTAHAFFGRPGNNPYFVVKLRRKPRITTDQA